MHRMKLISLSLLQILIYREVLWPADDPISEMLKYVDYVLIKSKMIQNIHDEAKDGNSTQSYHKANVLRMNFLCKFNEYIQEGNF